MLASSLPPGVRATPDHGGGRGSGWGGVNRDVRNHIHPGAWKGGDDYVLPYRRRQDLGAVLTLVFPLSHG